MLEIRARPGSAVSQPCHGYYLGKSELLSSQALSDCGPTVPGLPAVQV